MSNLPHQSPFGNPCVEGCPICEDANAAELATHLGLADETDPTIEADARAAESVSWGLFSPDLPRTYRDEDNPDELVEAWEFPDEEDDAARLELFPWAKEGGFGEWDLSPEEEAMELAAEAEWIRACREDHERLEWMEQEHAYYRALESFAQLGGFRDDC